MASRFDLAVALVEWARKRHHEWTRYLTESSRLGTVTVDFQIAIKEILEHLRSALDYCARELHSRFGNGNPKAKVYFPVALSGETERYFKAERVQNSIPGLAGARQDLVDLLAGYQTFTAPENGWLLDLSTLCNESKHEQLSLQRDVQVRVEIGPEHEGRPVYTVHRSDSTSFGKGFLFSIGKPIEQALPGQPVLCEGLYFRFDAINYEVNSFLETAIEGVGKIVQELKNKA